jgi:WW domain-binding protein 11
MLPPPGGSILPPGPHGASSSSSILPPPTSGPPASKAAAAAAAAAAGGGGGGGAPTITGASTVAKRPLAHQDKALTSMVPASVLVKREAAAKAAAAAAAGGAAVEELRIGPGFGLAPVQRRPAAGPGGRPQQKQQPLAPPPQLGRWGNAVTVTSLPQGSKAGGARGPGSSAAAGASSTAAKVDEKLVDFMSSLAELGAFD